MRHRHTRATAAARQTPSSILRGGHLVAPTDEGNSTAACAVSRYKKRCVALRCVGWRTVFRRGLCCSSETRPKKRGENDRHPEPHSFVLVRCCRFAWETRLLDVESTRRRSVERPHDCLSSPCHGRRRPSTCPWVKTAADVGVNVRYKNAHCRTGGRGWWCVGLRGGRREEGARSEPSINNVKRWRRPMDLIFWEGRARFNTYVLYRTLRVEYSPNNCYCIVTTICHSFWTRDYRKWH